jgi:acyl-CoA thioester hydrolase
MDNYLKELQVRWSDLDPNFHLRHSVYYDWGAFCRIEFLNAHGLSAEVMTKLNFGPILFREECIFRKEIMMTDAITIDLKLLKAKKDFSRWSIQHTIFKGGNIQCAILSVDGAWIDTLKRKLTAPPSHVANIFDEMPKSENFQWLD